MSLGSETPGLLDRQAQTLLDVFYLVLNQDGQSVIGIIEHVV